MAEAKNYNLRPLWQALLSIYQEVACICDRHSLRYQAAMGTVLGAVRHGGFIPWDDDFDIMMPRDDYDRFLKIAQTDLPDYLKTYLGGSVVKRPDGTSKTIWLHWCTLRDERETIVRDVESRSNLKITQGIYVDIFPIDGMPTSRLLFFFWRVCNAFLSAGGYSYTKASPAFMSGLWIRKHIIGRLARLVFPRCRSKEDFFWKVEAFGKRIPYSSSKFAGFVYSAIKGEMRQPRSLFDKSVSMKFEDIHIPIPQDYDQYLRLTFGDWRTLPPEEKRKPGHQTLR
jgi:lipopolysaccharide cholinephosphotransferase